MSKNCNQVNMPTVDNTELECDFFIDSTCVIVKETCKKVGKMTAKQKKYLAQLIAYHAIREKIDVDQMTQREASKKIDHIIFNYGVMKK